MTNPVWSLGINCYSHDAAVALLKNGEVIFTMEEERLNREKHSSAFPRLAIASALQFAGIHAHELNYFTYYFQPWRELYGNLSHVARYFPHTLQLLNNRKGGSSIPLLQRLKLQLSLGKTLQQELSLSLTPTVHYIEHHLAHAASCFYPSPFDEAAVLTWDGRGEDVSALFCYGQGTRLKKIYGNPVPHSLGHLYSAVTHHLGFKSFFDEWKVMGLSAYGSDRFLTDFRQLLRVNDESGRFDLDLKYFTFHYQGAGDWVSPHFTQLFGPRRDPAQPIEQRHYDLAFALQRVLEEAGVKIARALERRKLSHNLCMTGGVALNVLLNQKIIAETAFKNYFIQPIASDSGTSLGSALYHYHHNLGHSDRHPMVSPYLGPEYSDDEVEPVLINSRQPYRRSTNIVQEAALAITQNKIVGWFQGRLEAGPRALGNRSIVVNPMDPGMKDKLNQRVKRRESFRPFAPSVIEERCTEFFILPRAQTSPYMILSGHVRPEKKYLLPAITHQDGTARVHTVNREVNAKYWQLISAVGDLTGVPVVLNTSFNENEPIVTTPQHAVDCFLRTEFDVLVIGNFWLEKGSAS